MICEKHKAMFFVVGALLSPVYAFAVSGIKNTDVQIRGNLVASTCSINGVQKGTTANVPVDLGVVSTASFGSAGKIGGVVVPSILFSGCPANANITMVLDGVGDINQANKSYRNNVIPAFGGAQNIEVQIINAATGEVLDPLGGNSIIVRSDAFGSATSTMGVRFRSSGAATAGSFSAIAGFNLSYP